MRPHVAKIILLCAVLSSTAQLRAEPGSGDALALGHDALDLFRRDDYAGALARFQAANAIAHSPVFLLYIARCQRNLGRLLEARQSYRDVVDEKVDEKAPESWRSAQADAGSELAELSARIPSVVVEATFAPSAFEVDGEVLPPAKLGTEVELDPGPHRVTLRSSRGAVERSVVVREGDRAVRVHFAEPESPKPAPPATKVAASSVALERSDDRPPDYAIIVPVAVGTAALAVGTVAGIVALVKTNELKSRCDGNVCDIEDKPLVDPIRSWATVSTVAFGVAGAGFAVGAVFAFTAANRTDAGPRVGLLLSGDL